MLQCNGFTDEIPHYVNPKGNSKKWNLFDAEGENPTQIWWDYVGAFGVILLYGNNFYSRLI